MGNPIPDDFSQARVMINAPPALVAPFWNSPGHAAPASAR
ncbi:hypothetical protein THTE_0243 [Thermogutta terrifontis]|uniref:Uncharacterized protein n=1 Tax=Thermogutta terrifontis TaxID=1331910 RepID=A0A286RA48_9BACT|nr:hypothetical protein THTE_0243 [Thermogutta terrifontis]